MTNTQRKTTQPNLADCSLIHARVAASGNKDHLSSWQYNVEDRFKDKSTEEIRQALRETSFPYAVCIENLSYDYNIGTVIRNANAFNAREVFYVGEKRYDKRGRVGVQNYTDITWLETIDQLAALKDRYRFIAVDNTPRAISLNEYQWDDKTPCMLVFGGEGTGISTHMQMLCDDAIKISQYGSIRSLNVGTASGIVMHSLVSSIMKERKINEQVR
jgi:tRNA G18 (ribose-2'-O)-methylase SpoU